jgi:hypothetical protein
MKALRLFARQRAAAPQPQRWLQMSLATESRRSGAAENATRPAAHFLLKSRSRPLLTADKNSV